ncbi:MAG: S-layer homology domain-containing protein [Oscillospiraceae bacterium]|nr:S-layer homology domain-containing protein [Oscillospiraceae bacterium]
MRRHSVKAAISFFICATLILAPILPAFAFLSDVPSDWANEEVLKAREYGLIPAGMYHSFLSDVTRSEFCRLVMALYTKITGEPEKLNLPSVFTDTANTSILNAFELGIVKGVGGGFFLPGNPITRQEIAVMLFNTINAINASTGKDILGSPTTSMAFADRADTADWAVDAIQNLRSNEIMLGDGRNHFNPLDNTTKEMAFILVNRIYLIYSGLDAKKAFPTAYTGEILMRIKGSIFSSEEYQIIGDVYEQYPDVTIADIAGYMDGAPFTDNNGALYYINRSESLSESVSAGYAGGQYYPVYVLAREGAALDRLFIVADGGQYVDRYNVFLDSERKEPYFQKTFSDVLFPVPGDTYVVFGEPDSGGGSGGSGSSSSTGGGSGTSGAGGGGSGAGAGAEVPLGAGDVGAEEIVIPESGDIPAGTTFAFAALHRDAQELLDIYIWRVRLSMGKVTHLAALLF